MHTLDQVAVRKDWKEACLRLRGRVSGCGTAGSTSRAGFLEGFEHSTVTAMSTRPSDPPVGRPLALETRGNASGAHARPAALRGIRKPETGTLALGQLTNLLMAAWRQA